MSAVEVIPSARRIIRSLRDMGYDFAQAVADIVDNSIEADATTVAIDVEFDGDDSWVRIADNGKGMRPQELREAMRYGSDRDYDADDLGKFGLGLKTASMSQCQRLSVASRWNPERADIAAYAWDLEHIEKTNRWEIIPLERSDICSAIREPLVEVIGTVVLWQRLDRILGYKHPYGEAARKRLSQMCRDVEQHLGMVFHRFLGGEIRRKKLKLFLNGHKIEPWDPFCRSEPHTQALQPVVLPLEHEDTSGEILLQPFILPHQEDFSSPEAFRNASGPANWNQQQGFYTYRAGRLIQSGGWSHLRAPDEHTKLARVAVDFPPALDEAFKINVAKMRVQMPAQIRDDVRTATAPVIKLAREVYSKKKRKSASTTNNPKQTTSASASTNSQHSTPPVSNKGWGSNAQSGSSQSSLLTLQQWTERTLAAATEDERPTVQAVLARLDAGKTGRT